MPALRRCRVAGLTITRPSPRRSTPCTRLLLSAAVARLVPPRCRSPALPQRRAAPCTRLLLSADVTRLAQQLSSPALTDGSSPAPPAPPLL
ncbi:hypothetical protein E2562_027853 [Oryza meyeriana var. granulata]|uniref:Uncharacterized protein n=1 Tax=Oryza meyeriana var. granulata TaxID=110450 RepID=A0A6G1DPD1_9ORYZ|nr:hypothetical protein E2562_027853 [Oryza meyeriana var. granulata]